MSDIIPKRPTTQPLSTKLIIRVLLCLLIAATFFAGYYANLVSSQRRRINTLEQSARRVMPTSNTINF